jgi:hypothetical protein
MHPCVLMVTSVPVLSPLVHWRGITSHILIGLNVQYLAYFNLVYLFVLSIALCSTYSFFILYPHVPSYLLGYCMPHILISLGNYFPWLVMHCNRVVIDRLLAAVLLARLGGSSFYPQFNTHTISSEWYKR